MPPNRPTWDEYFLSLAEAVSQRADCTRRKVGAVLVNQQHRVIGVGYNGAPSGEPGCMTESACPRGRMGFDQVRPLSDYDTPGSPGFCIAIHAEENAVMHSTERATGSTIYINFEPCYKCQELLKNAGVSAAVWNQGRIEF